MLRRVILAFGLLGVAACSRETAVEAGVRDQVLHVGNAAEPHDLDPTTNSGDYEGRIISALFEGLVVLANDGTTILPGVAERWEISPDGRTYVFHLRANARWSNGDPVTAFDFRDSFLRLLEPRLGCEAADQPFEFAGGRDYRTGRRHDPTAVGLRAPDARTFVLTLEQPAPYLLSVLANYPFLPVHRPTLEKFGGWLNKGTAWTRAGNLVGNGCFVLAEWRPDQVIVVRKNPLDWAADRVRLREVRFYPIADRTVEENAYRAGQLHVTSWVPFSKLDSYRQRQAPELRSAAWLDTHYMIFNTTRPPFQDARVRRAFSLAINRERLARDVQKDSSTPAHSFTFPGTGGYEPPDDIHYDPAEARRLLAEAGYPGGAGFPTVEWMIAGSSSGELTEAIQQGWAKDLGVQVTLLNTEWKIYLDAMAARNFQLGALGWGYFANDASYVLQLATGSFASNYTGWHNAAYDRAFATAQDSLDGAGRRRAFDTMEQLIATEAPMSPILHYRRVHLVHPAVHGWRDNLLDQVDWREVWLGK